MSQIKHISYIKGVPLYNDYDVVVCGGGPAGTVAALAAKREGLKILLIEGMGQLGGMAVTGLVSQWLGGRTQEGEWVVRGLFKSLAEEATRDGCAILPQLKESEKYHPYGWFNWFIHGVPVDPFKIDLFFDVKMKEAGVEVLLQTFVVDVIVKDQYITHVVLYNRSGIFAVSTKTVIDATGNADVAEFSGCETVKGREKDGKMTVSSLIMHVYGVDEEQLTRAIEKSRDPKFRDLINDLKATGEWNFPGDIFICTKLLEYGEFYINTNRIIGVDGTDGFSVSEGLKSGRESLHRLMGIMNRHFPGFKNAKIKTVAPQLGIRETRRIVGEYKLSVDDLSNERTFDDCIGFSMYGWDLPDPEHPALQPFASDTKAGYTYKVKKGLSTPIPYRIMIPRPVKNLICPGRAVSVERQVLGPVRVMAPCMAMGEAAGVAVAQVVRDNVAFAEIDILKLRGRLRLVDVLVDREQLPMIYPRIDQS